MSSIVPHNANPTTSALPLTQDMTHDRWLDVGHDIAQAVKRSMWWLGDWWNHGDRQWGTGPADAEAIGMAYQTCRNAGSVAARFDLYRRRDNLSFSHHAVVAALPELDQEHLLDRAEAEGWTREQTRTEAQQHRRSIEARETQHMNIEPDYGPYAVHWLDDLFPLIYDDQWDAMVRSIAEYGLLMPITLTHDESTIVDGRIRYLACMEANVWPVFKTLPAAYTDEMIENYIISANIHRQTFTPDQLAMIGVRLADLTAQLDLPPWTVAKTATVVGVPDRAIKQARAIHDEAPDLAEQVHAGTLDAATADKRRKERDAGRL
jgi:hypothetical protein